LKVLTLSGNKLTGGLPDTQGSMQVGSVVERTVGFGEGLLSSSLKVLTLSGNKLTGGLPDTQGSMQVGHRVAEQSSGVAAGCLLFPCSAPVA
jgi:hypothetical protein